MGFIFAANPFATPNLVTAVVMIGWMGVVLYVFSRFSAQRAIVLSFVMSWLFLPEAVLPLTGIPDYSKASATCYGILIATCIFDVDRFRSFRLSWVDLPVLMVCICPFFASITNDLGPYDGITATIDQTMTWGIPYLLGRVYLSDLAGLNQLAIGIFAGGLVYIPLCLFESRFSPQLHRIIYGGGSGNDFLQAIRLGGYRPTVFMQHGLAVGAFMMAATLISIHLWQSKVIRQVRGIPIHWLAFALLFTFIMLRSTGAYIYFVLGIAILLIGRYFHTTVLAFALIVGIGVYLYLNAATETYITDQITAFLSNYLSEDRLGSLVFRFDNEELLVDKARQKILFGWGGWGRALVSDQYGDAITVQDSLWIIAFGHHGAFGLISLYTFLLLPVASLFWLRCPASSWFKRDTAPAVALALCLLLYALDSLLNAMINPLFILSCGGISGFVLKGAQRRSNRTIQRGRVLRLPPVPESSIQSSENL